MYNIRLVNISSRFCFGNDEHARREDAIFGASACSINIYLANLIALQSAGTQEVPVAEDNHHGVYSTDTW